MSATLLKSHCQHWSFGGVKTSNPFSLIPDQRHIHLLELALPAQSESLPSTFGVFTLEDGQNDDWWDFDIAKCLEFTTLESANEQFASMQIALKQLQLTSINSCSLGFCKSESFLESMKNIDVFAELEYVIPEITRWH